MKIAGPISLAVSGALFLFAFILLVLAVNRKENPDSPGSTHRAVRYDFNGKTYAGGWPSENSDLQIATACLGIVVSLLGVVLTKIPNVALVGCTGLLGVATFAIGLAACVVDIEETQDALDKCKKTAAISNCNNSEYAYVAFSDLFVALLSLAVVAVSALVFMQSKKEEKVAPSPVPEQLPLISNSESRKEQTESKVETRSASITDPAATSSAFESRAEDPAKTSNESAASTTSAAASKSNPVEKPASSSGTSAPVSASTTTSAAPSNPPAVAASSRPVSSKETTKPAPAETKPVPADTKPVPVETKPAPSETKPAPAPAPTPTAPATSSSKATEDPRPSADGPAKSQEKEPSHKQPPVASDPPAASEPASAGSSSSAPPPINQSPAANKSAGAEPVAASPAVQPEVTKPSSEVPKETTAPAPAKTEDNPTVPASASNIPPPTTDSDPAVSQTVPRLNSKTQLVYPLEGVPPFFGALMRDGDSSRPGVLVADSMPFEGCMQALIADGDYVLEIDGRKIEDRVEVGPILKLHRPGDVVRMKIARGNAPSSVFDVDVELGAKGWTLPDIREARRKAGLPVFDRPLWSKETALTALQGLKAYTGLTCKDIGTELQITALDEDSPVLYAKPPLSVGAVLLSLDRKPLESLQALRDELRKKTPGEVVVFEFRQAGKTGFSQVEASAKGKSVSEVRCLREMAGLKAVSATAKS